MKSEAMDHIPTYQVETDKIDPERFPQVPMIFIIQLVNFSIHPAQRQIIELGSNDCYV